MKKLKEESSIVDFVASGDPPERYTITLNGKGLSRESDYVEPAPIDVHRVEIRLGIDYPRSRPDLQWLTKIYHPNISGVGAVCLGGYGTHWVPSLNLDELVEMLWDMVRYQNYDPKSAYNYQAARWCEQQTKFALPLDPRPVRDRVGATKGDNIIKIQTSAPRPSAVAPAPPPPAYTPPPSRPTPHPAEVVEEGILIIDDASPEPVRPMPRPRPRPVVADDDIMIIE